MSTVLVTGFGPYGNTPTNPAEAVAEKLGGTTLDGAQVVGRVVGPRGSRSSASPSSAAGPAAERPGR